MRVKPGSGAFVIHLFIFSRAKYARVDVEFMSNIQQLLLVATDQMGLAPRSTGTKVPYSLTCSRVLTKQFDHSLSMTDANFSTFF